MGGRERGTVAEEGESMKNRRLLLVSGAIFIVIVACIVMIYPRAVSNPTLRLYAGAGLRPAVEKLTAAFTAQTGIAVEPDYGGSGIVLARARDDQQADLFLPGDGWYVARLQALSGNVAEEANLGRLIPVIIVAKNNPKEIHKLHDLAQPGVRVALGDPQACQVGRVSTQILAQAGMSINDLHPQLALTVNELAIWVKMRNVDAAIVWETVATELGSDVEIIPIPREHRVDSDVVLARLSQSHNPLAASRFVAFAKSPAGQAILRQAGYQPVSETNSQAAKPDQPR